MHPSRLPGREVAEHDGRPVGFVAGWLDVDDDPLQTPEWRRHGYVSDLVRGQPLAGPGRGAPADRRFLCVNEPALAAFRRFGFEPFEVVLDLPLP